MRYLTQKAKKKNPWTPHLQHCTIDHNWFTSPCDICSNKHVQGRAKVRTQYLPAMPLPSCWTIAFAANDHWLFSCARGPSNTTCSSNTSQCITIAYQPRWYIKNVQQTSVVTCSISDSHLLNSRFMIQSLRFFIALVDASTLHLSHQQLVAKQTDSLTSLFCYWMSAETCLLTTSLTFRGL